MQAAHNQGVSSDQVEAVKSQLKRGYGHVHMIGIGGVGMAGLALHLAKRGFRVTGCDTGAGRITDWLVSHGITLRRGHDESHIDREVDWVVHTAAVDADHDELRKSRSLRIPVFTRGVVLPALLEGQTSVAVSGTHG